MYPSSTIKRLSEHSGIEVFEIEGSQKEGFIRRNGRFKAHLENIVSTFTEGMMVSPRK